MRFHLNGAFKVKITLELMMNLWWRWEKRGGEVYPVPS